MTVHTNTFPVHVCFPVDTLTINVVSNNMILAFKLLKRCDTIHVSRFCGSSQHNDVASLKKNTFRFPRCNIASATFYAISKHHTHRRSILKITQKEEIGAWEGHPAHSNFPPTLFPSTKTARVFSTLSTVISMAHLAY